MNHASPTTNHESKLSPLLRLAIVCGSQPYQPLPLPPPLKNKGTRQDSKHSGLDLLYTSVRDDIKTMAVDVQLMSHHSVIGKPLVNVKPIPAIQSRTVQEEHSSQSTAVDEEIKILTRKHPSGNESRSPPEKSYTMINQQYPSPVTSQKSVTTPVQQNLDAQMNAHYYQQHHAYQQQHQQQHQYAYEYYDYQHGYVPPQNNRYYPQGHIHPPQNQQSHAHSHIHAQAHAHHNPYPYAHAQPRQPVHHTINQHPYHHSHAQHVNTQHYQHIQSSTHIGSLYPNGNQEHFQLPKMHSNWGAHQN